MIELILQTASTEASFPAAAQCRVTLPAAAAQTAASADPATSPTTATAAPTATTASTDAATAATTTATATTNHTPKLQHQHEHEQPQAGGRKWEWCRQRGWHSGQSGRSADSVTNHHPPKLRGDTAVPNGNTVTSQFRTNPSNAGAVFAAVVLPTATATTDASSPTADSTGPGYGRCVDDGTNATIPAAIDATTCVLQ